MVMLRDYEGMALPRLGGTLAQDAVPCYCGSCAEAFREWLRPRYGPRELRDWGIRSLDEFSPRTYLLRARRQGEAILTDLILREWIRWKYLSHHAKWGEFVLRLKENGDAEERGVMIGAAPGAAGCANPYTVAAGGFHDFWLVSGGGDSDQRLRGLLEIPLWLNSGPGGTAVWATPRNVDDLLERRPPGPLSAEEEAFLAAATVLGAIPVLPAPPESVHAAGPIPGASAVVSGAASAYRLRRLIERYRSLYAYRQSYHNVAVVYSVPSMMWAAKGEEPDAHSEAFVRTCRLLVKDGIPFDVLVFDHPLMSPDQDRLGVAGKYDAVLLPGVDCVSAAQVGVLRQRAAQGTRVYVEGRCGDFDEDFNPRTKPAIEGVEIRDLGDTTKVLDELRSLAWVEVSRTGPAPVVAAWRSQGGKMFAVHLARLQAAEDMILLPLRIAVKTPPKFVPEEVLFLTPENPDGIPLNVKTDASGRLVSEVPGVSGYGVLVYHRDGYLRTAADALAARRQGDRKRVSRSARGRAGIEEPRVFLSPDEATSAIRLE